MKFTTWRDVSPFLLRLLIFETDKVPDIEQSNRLSLRLACLSRFLSNDGVGVAKFSVLLVLVAEFILETLLVVAGVDTTAVDPILALSPGCDCVKSIPRNLAMGR